MQKQYRGKSGHPGTECVRPETDLRWTTLCGEQTDSLIRGSAWKPNCFEGNGLKRDSRGRKIFESRGL